MGRELLIATTLTGISVALAAGCGETNFNAALAPSLEDVNEIRSDDSLEPQEKRIELGKLLGIDDPNELSDPSRIEAAIINGLLMGERLANQFGGDLSSAFEKVIHVGGAAWTELTPDEVQVYGDATNQTTYSDAEAQAIVDFFDEYEINSSSDLQDVLDEVEIEVPAEIDEDTLVAVFITTSPDNVRDKLP